MEKMRNILRDIVKRIFFIGFGIQIVLGTIWMCFNLSYLQAFSCQWGLFSGGLYTLCKRLYPLVYPVQIAFALWAGYFLFRVLLGGEKRWCSLFGSLVLFTFPFGLQFHLAIGPYSLICSFSLLFGGFLIRLCRGKDEAKNLVLAFCCLGALAVLSRLSFWAGLCTVCVILAVQSLLKAVRRKTGIFRNLMLFLALTGCILGMDSLLQGGLVPTEEEVEYALFCRTVWPSLYKDRGILPEEWQEYVCEYYAGGQLTVTDFDSVLRKGIVEKYGSEQAVVFYRNMRAAYWVKQKPYLIKQCAGDAIGTVLLPLFYRRQLEGKWYASCLGRNYELFLMNTPRLSRCIAEYCMYSFPFLVFLSVVLAVCTGRPREKGMLGLMVLAGVVSLFAMLRGAGQLDCKETLFAALIIDIFAVSRLFSGAVFTDRTAHISEEREDGSCSKGS